MKSVSEHLSKIEAYPFVSLPVDVHENYGRDFWIQIGHVVIKYDIKYEMIQSFSSNLTRPNIKSNVTES